MFFSFLISCFLNAINIYCGIDIVAEKQIIIKPVQLPKKPGDKKSPCSMQGLNKQFYFININFFVSVKFSVDKR